jgi:hypothetical protein
MAIFTKRTNNMGSHQIFLTPPFDHSLGGPSGLAKAPSDGESPLQHKV